MDKLQVLIGMTTERKFIEGLFKKFQIRRKDWDKSKVFHFNKHDVVIYNYVCDDYIHNIIKQKIRDFRKWKTES